MVDIITIILEAILNTPTESEIQTDTFTVPGGGNRCISSPIHFLTIIDSAGNIENTDFFIWDL